MRRKAQDVKLISKYVQDCITFNLKPAEALEYIKIETGISIPSNTYFLYRSRLKGEKHTNNWLTYYTRIGFVQEHRQLLDNIKRVQEDRLRQFWLEAQRETRNERLISLLNHDIIDNSRLIADLMDGTPIIASIKARLMQQQGTTKEGRLKAISDRVQAYKDKHDQQEPPPITTTNTQQSYLTHITSDNNEGSTGVRCTRTDNDFTPRKMIGNVHPDSTPYSTVHDSNSNSNSNNDNDSLCDLDFDLLNMLSKQTQTQTEPQQRPPQRNNVSMPGHNGFEKNGGKLSNQDRIVTNLGDTDNKDANKIQEGIRGTTTREPETAEDKEQIREGKGPKTDLWTV